MTEQLRALLEEMQGCFQAASTEGLEEKMREDGCAVGSIADIVQRRLLWVPPLVEQALALLNQPADDAADKVAEAIEDCFAECRKTGERATAQLVAKAALAALPALSRLAEPEGYEDMDSAPSVIFESGRQEANKEWRDKLYHDGGKEIIELLLKHYSRDYLLVEIQESTPSSLSQQAEQFAFSEHVIAGLQFIGVTVEFPPHCPGEVRLSLKERHTQMRLPTLPTALKQEG